MYSCFTMALDVLLFMAVIPFNWTQGRAPKATTPSTQPLSTGSPTTGIPNTVKPTIPQVCSVPVNKTVPPLSCDPLCGTGLTYHSTGKCLSNGRCLCWWGWTGANACYVDGGIYNNRILAENCVERCHYTHVYRDKKCVTASPTTTPSTQSIGTGNPTSIPLTTVIPRTGSPSTVKPTTGKPVPPTSRRPAKGKPTIMESTAGKSSTMNITIGNPTSSNPTTGEQVTTGPATSKTKAKQQDLAAIIAHPQNTTQMEGGNVTFTCDATTNPVSSFSWTKDGSVVNATSTIILSSDNKQLTIINVSRGDSGHYTCVATNDVKTVQSNVASLDVQLVPSSPENVTVISKTSRVVNISWTPGFNGNSNILNYTVEISRNNQTFGEATCQGLSSSACVVSSCSLARVFIEGLHPGRTYYIRVFATNKVGSSTASSVITTTTDEEGTKMLSNIAQPLQAELSYLCCACNFMCI